MPSNDITPTGSAPTAVAPDGAVRTIAAELDGVLERVADTQAEALADLTRLLGTADRVFVHGAGRSGLALRMVAMRLMHLGLDVHVVGETTSPAIRAGDVLLTASGSGTTGGIVRAAETAVEVGALVGALTSASASPLAELAAVVVIVPAQAKQDHGSGASVQYSGSLFEQALLVTGDALFHTLWLSSGATAEELWPRHANLE